MTDPSLTSPDVHLTSLLSRLQALRSELPSAQQKVVDLVLADLATWDWPEAAFDAVVAIFIQFADPALREQIFAGMRKAVRPGGLILLQGYRPEQIAYGTGGPRVAENLYTETMLREAFAGWEILHLAGHDSMIEEGAGHKGMSALIDLVVRRP